MALQILADGVIAGLLIGAIYYIYALNNRLDRLEFNKKSLNTLLDDFNESLIKIQKSHLYFQEKVEVNLEDLKNKIKLCKQLKDDLEMLYDRSDRKADEMEKQLHKLTHYFNDLKKQSGNVTNFSQREPQNPPFSREDNLIQKLKDMK